jgi:hypothetical protein
MKIEKQGKDTRLVLSAKELGLLKRALERASYVDTPASEQADIQAFCEQALEALSHDGGSGKP